jgi:hypothetical protein
MRRKKRRKRRTKVDSELFFLLLYPFVEGGHLEGITVRGPGLTDRANANANANFF